MIHRNREAYEDLQMSLSLGGACESDSLHRCSHLASTIFDVRVCTTIHGMNILQAEEKELINGSSDFLGLNHYSSDFVIDNAEGDFISHWGKPSKGEHAFTRMHACMQVMDGLPHM